MQLSTHGAQLHFLLKRMELLMVDNHLVVQSRRKPVARATLYKRRGLITAEDAENLKNWKGGGGFSVNADVCIDSDDRKGLERLLRYCARPPFSGEKLTAISTFGEKADAMRLLYEVNKNSQNSEQPLISSHHLAGIVITTQCGETMKIIAYITNATSIHKILTYMDEESEQPKMRSARGPPDNFYCEDGEASEYQYDQTINW